MKIVKKYGQYIVLVLFIAVLIIVFSTFKKKTTEYTVKNHDFYQYFASNKVVYSGYIKLYKKDNKIVLTVTDESIELDSKPVYYADEKKAIFPQNMAVIFPLSGTSKKINYFSEATLDGDFVYVKDHNFNSTIQNALLYDGDNLYVILEKSKLTNGTESYDLSPMSYAFVDPTNSLLEIYNYDEDKFTSIDKLNSDIIIENDKYRVNASFDYMYYNNKARLLLKKVDKLDNLE